MRLASALARGALLAFTLAVTASVVAQDWLGLAPLGGVDRDAQDYHRLALACALALAAVAAALASELAFGRPRRLARFLRRALVAAIVLEAILFAVDVAFVSHTPVSTLGGPYWETRAATDAEWVPLHRAHAGSALGFRWNRERALEPRGTRLLFLGDSYTEGSGRGPKCNYPDVVESALARTSGAEVEAMNAGVAGYGLREEANLLRFLRARDYRFQAVVVSVFLENDLSDGPPGTERRVYWGMIERLPSAPWLAVLHPLNTRAFRLGSALARLFRADQGDRLATWRADQPCRLNEAEITPLPLSPELERTFAQRLKGSAAVDAEPRALDELVASLADLRAQTRALGVPLFVVVFPDRVLGDPRVRAALGADVSAPARVRARTLAALADYAPIDATDVLAATPHAYRPIDTHLSDRGNLVAGTFVATRIAERAAAVGLALPAAARRP